MIKTVESNQEAEIVVKKSKFIAHLFYVESEEEAQEKIKEIKKIHRDARHNCYAYIVNEMIDGRSVIIERFSDDGEPSGTAGAPMLDILKKQGLSNVLVIVTRYFGGILLGTGGLVKAYSDATKIVIEQVSIIEKNLGTVYQVEVAYNDLKDLLYNCQKLNIIIKNTIYDENVKIELQSEKEKMQELLNNNKNIINIYIIKDNVYIEKT